MPIPRFIGVCVWHRTCTMGGMAYTVRLIVQVPGTNRRVMAYIRDEFSPNTKANATRFASREEAQTEVDAYRARCEQSPHVVFVRAIISEVK